MLPSVILVNVLIVHALSSEFTVQYHMRPSGTGEIEQKAEHYDLMENSQLKASRPYIHEGRTG